MEVLHLIKYDAQLINEEHLENLKELCRRVSIIETKLNLQFTVSSGYRSLKDHERIYKTINARRLAQNLPPVRVPMGSRHLFGKAVDVADIDGTIQKKLLDNVSLLEEVGLWCENFDYTSSPKKWVHFQSEPPKSGNRFFKP